MMAKDADKTVWQRVKEALNDAGLPPTQVHAASIIGAAQGSISDWNKKGNYPTVENAVAIAKATRTCVEWVITGRGPRRAGPPDDRVAAELWSIWNSLPDTTKGQILGIAQSNAYRGSVYSERGSDELQRDRDGPLIVRVRK